MGIGKKQKKVDPKFDPKRRAQLRKAKGKPAGLPSLSRVVGSIFMAAPPGESVSVDDLTGFMRRLVVRVRTRGNSGFAEFLAQEQREVRERREMRDTGIERWEGQFRVERALAESRYAHAVAEGEEWEDQDENELEARLDQGGVEEEEEEEIGDPGDYWGGSDGDDEGDCGAGAGGSAGGFGGGGIGGAQAVTVS
ncbi:uncharacterized protein PAC_01691 [Phialocephala subalpina]|uniref:Uncharacterized protein n=1 Tax=Phialocephala subalpina TaxID=576137 RepID=A0A1L7WGB7_9HELO|nr:uncharacterized protein PAC_01691 [Phialocephala subalpina]